MRERERALLSGGFSRALCRWRASRDRVDLRAHRRWQPAPSEPQVPALLAGDAFLPCSLHARRSRARVQLALPRRELGHFEPTGAASPKGASPFPSSLNNSLIEPIYVHIVLFDVAGEAPGLRHARRVHSGPAHGEDASGGAPPAGHVEREDAPPAGRRAHALPRTALGVLLERGSRRAQRRTARRLRPGVPREPRRGALLRRRPEAPPPVLPASTRSRANARHISGLQLVLRGFHLFLRIKVLLFMYCISFTPFDFIASAGTQV